MIAWIGHLYHWLELWLPWFGIFFMHSNKSTATSLLINAINYSIPKGSWRVILITGAWGQEGQILTSLLQLLDIPTFTVLNVLHELNPWAKAQSRQWAQILWISVEHPKARFQCWFT
jgi:hypothetical protein